jgi:hypothetical protein
VSNTRCKTPWPIAAVSRPSRVTSDETGSRRDRVITQRDSRGDCAASSGDTEEQYTIARMNSPTRRQCFRTIPDGIHRRLSARSHALPAPHTQLHDSALIRTA